MATIQQLLAILPNSMQTAILAEDITRLLSLQISEQQLEARQLIRAAIREGHVIVSNTWVGYWLSSDKSEVQEYITALENKAKDTLQRADELKQAWNLANPANPL
ncbi:MAG: hypothetical protein LBH19_03965 [Dysgonamonadaceae bacterium]|jgi:predicted DNA-binding transcriptional regulator|nr:hypothetical protein [Dysgonamonadaceae bacterium]